MSGDLALRWSPPGPVAAAFMRSGARVPMINGPIGSGKTSTNIIKHIGFARAQPQSPLDGLRKYKLTVVHQTFRQLWRSTIPSYWRWLPKHLGEWTGGRDEPSQHVVTMELPDRTRLQWICDFIAIGDHAIEDVLRGYEPTSFFLNEVDLMLWEVMVYCRGRAGRYPPMSEGGPAWYGVTADCNAPVVDSEFYEQVFDGAAAGVELFRQPGGRDPAAENLENLPRGYYDNQVTGQPQWYVDRMVDNKPIASRSGKAVHPSYNDLHHCAPHDLEPVPGRALRIGLDAGGKPAAEISQRLPNGQFRGLDELVAPEGAFMGAERFARELNLLLDERYKGFERRDIVAHADPSAIYGVDRENDERDWIQIVSAKTGIRIKPARTNSLSVRLAAVDQVLKPIDAHTPGLQISPRQKVLRAGFNGAYRFRKLLGASNRYDDKPDKNHASHPQDGFQYDVMAEVYDEVLGRERHLRSRRGGLQRRALSDENRDGRYAGADDDELTRPRARRGGLQRVAEG